MNKRGFKESTGDEGKTIVNEESTVKLKKIGKVKKEVVAKMQVQRIKETCPALRVHKKGISQSYLYPHPCYNRLMVTHKQSK